MDSASKDLFVSLLIPICSLIGIAWAAVLWKRVASVKVSGGVAVRGNNGGEYLLEEEQRGDEEVFAPAYAPILSIYTGTPSCFVAPRDGASSVKWSSDENAFST